MKFKPRSLTQIADLICGNTGPSETAYFPYRSSSCITEFFEEVDTYYKHDGSSRQRWVADVLAQILAEPHEGPTTPPDAFLRSSTDSWTGPTPLTSCQTDPRRWSY